MIQYKALPVINNTVDSGFRRVSQNRKKPKKQTKAKELDSSGLFLFCLQEVHYLHFIME